MNKLPEGHLDITWRPYQLECKQQIKQNFEAGITKQLIAQATGTGKRLQAVDLMRHFRNEQILFLCHREELIMQAYEEIDAIYPMQVGIIKAQRFEADKRIVVASVQTIHNRLDRLRPDKFGMMIVDEGHHYVAPTYLKPLRHFEPRLTTIWTATPKRLDGLSLSNIAEKIVYEYRIEDGIRDGYLAKLDAYQIKTPADISKVKRTAGDFNQKELVEKVDTELRNELIAAKYKEYSVGEQAVVYCVDIQHAYHVRNKFREHGISAETIVSDTECCPNRRELLKAFEKGEFQVMTNVEILTEGWDYEDIGMIIMARPTQSETLYIQCIGRGTRLKSDGFQRKFGHGRCTILDFVDNTGKHSLVNCWELEKGKIIEDRMFLPDKKKKELLALKEERIRRERTMKIKYGFDRKIDILKLPVVKVWDSEKMLEPATEKQIKWLQDVGIWQEDVEYTKKQASELISALPCADWQIKWLASHHYDVSSGATIGQFQRVKRTYEEEHKFEMKNPLNRPGAITL